MDVTDYIISALADKVHNELRDNNDAIVDMNLSPKEIAIEHWLAIRSEIDKKFGINGNDG